MNNELVRLATFRNWPETERSCSPLSLALWGFYFSGFRTVADQQQQQQDAVITCFACSQSFVRWTSLECLKEKHRRRSPHCPRRDLNAVLKLPAVEPQRQQQFPSRLETEGVPAAFLTTRPMTGLDSAAVDTQLADVLKQCSRRNAEKNRGHSDSKAQLRCETVRLLTFKTWPKSSVVSANDLARSGFHYSGSSDTVVCAFCEIRINNWVDGDVPDEEHRKYSPVCPFVEQNFCRPLTIGSSRNETPAVIQKSWQELIDETLQLWNDRVCHICYNKEVNRVTVPCGHLFCDVCLLTVQEQDRQLAIKCPICRQRCENVAILNLPYILNEDDDPIENPTFAPRPT